MGGDNQRARSFGYGILVCACSVILAFFASRAGRIFLGVQKEKNCSFLLIAKQVSQLYSILASRQVNIMKTWLSNEGKHLLVLFAKIVLNWQYIDGSKITIKKYSINF